MNIVISKLDNIVIERGEYDIHVEKILSQNVENFPEMYGSIIFPCNEVKSSASFKAGKIFNMDIYKLLEKMKFKEDFGNIEFDNMKEIPVICFLLPSGEAEIQAPPDKRLLKVFDAFYRKINYSFQAVSIAFSVACWMVKDCCVTSTVLYQFNYFNAYSVRNNIENIYTFSNGEIFSKNSMSKS